MQICVEKLKKECENFSVKYLQGFLVREFLGNKIKVQFQ